MARAPKRTRSETASSGGEEERHEEEQRGSSKRKKGEKTPPPMDYGAVIAVIEAEAAHGSARRTIGAAAQAGVIKSITLRNFMCHAHLSTDYHPKMNFIHGHNGSGKSALLTGITVALGGRAAVTGRAGGLKDLIKSGQTDASVIIKLANAGSDAFEHETYGDEIIIERNFTDKGSSSYKISSGKDKKVVTQNRADLNRILDHMNIQIDNPMNVLTQDNARTFIANDDERAKYQWFLRGTQLDQLRDNYDETDLRLKVSEKKLEESRKNLPALREKVRKYAERVQKCQRQMGLGAQVEAVEGKLMWAHVKQCEDSIAQARDALAIDVGKIQGHKAAMAVLEADQEMTRIVIADGDEKLQEYTATRGPLQEKAQKLKKARDEVKAKISQSQFAHSESVQEIKILEKSIGLTQKAIDDQTKLDSPEAVAERDAKQETLNKLKKQLTMCETSIDAEKSKQTEAQQRLEAAEAEVEQREQNARYAKGRSFEVARDLKSLEHQRGGNRLNAFGVGLDLLQKEIDRETWMGPKPIGPLGMYVKLKDHRYEKVVSSSIGIALCQYAVQNVADRSKLLAIMKELYASKLIRFNHGQEFLPGIITHSGRSLDFSKGDLRHQGPTVLSILEFTSDDVRDILITKANIERTFVLPTRDEALSLLWKLGQGTALTQDEYTVQKRQNGGPSVHPSLWWKGGRFFVRDVSGDIGEAQETLKKAEDTLAQCIGDVQVAKDVAKKAYDDVQLCKNRVGRIEKTIRDHGKTIRKLEDELSEEQTVEIDALMIQLQEYEGNIVTHVTQRDALVKQMDSLNEELNGINVDIEAINQGLRDFDSVANGMREGLQEPTELLLKIAHKLKHEQLSVDKYEGHANHKREQIEELEEDLRLRLDMARTSPRPQESLDKEKLLAELRKLQKARELAHKDDGINLEEASRSLKQAADELAGKEESNDLLDGVLQTLRDGLTTRRLKWSMFRGFISLRAKINFTNTLARRGQVGKLLINHQLGVLKILVGDDKSGPLIEVNELGDATNDGQLRYKASSALSGGERSFATISLLLSLWEAAECPIRCLDEFDVFMDQVNRDLTMKMLMESAMASEDRQYILITPQDINIGSNRHLKIIKVKDPERNQGVLRLGAP